MSQVSRSSFSIKNAAHLFSDKFSHRHLKADIEDGKEEGVPKDVTHTQASDEKVPQGR